MFMRLLAYCSTVLLCSVSCPANISVGNEFNATIFCSVGKAPLIILSMMDVAVRTGSAKLLTVTNITPMELSSIWTSNTIVQKTSFVYLVDRFSSGLLQGCIVSSQSYLASTSSSRLGLSRMLGRS